MGAYYNEIDPFAAAWLRELIKGGHIAAGVVDERDVRDVEPRELEQFTQCHFFAGIGVWSYALRLANWPDDRPVWTGSCPCQPFSAAGKGGGFADERHLWPAWNHLIGERRPPIVFGEQVASKDGLDWFDLVSADLEASGYACGALDTCAAGFGAPHIRQRLYFVAQRLDDAAGARRIGAFGGAEGFAWDEARLRVPCARSDDDGMADADGGNARAEGLQRGRQYGLQPQDGGAGLMAHANGRQRDGIASGEGCERDGQLERGGAALRPGPVNGFWRTADWLFCRDEKWRPVEPGTFPLADGAPARVGRLRGYGNAIVPQVAATFIEAFTDTLTA